MATDSDVATKVTRRKSPKQPRAVVTADAILQATQRIIVKEGFKSATTNRIAEMAGVSVGSLYQYFPNKQAIVQTLIQDTVAKAAARVRHTLRDLMDEPLEPALRQIMVMLLDMYRENSFILFRILDEVPELREYTEHLAVEIYTYSTNLAFLEQHRAYLKVDDLHAALLAVERETIRDIELYLEQDSPTLSEDQFIEHLTQNALAALARS